MKLPPGFDKWGSAVLGLVSLLLVARLVNQYRGWQPGNSRAHAASASAPTARVEKASSHETQDLVQYDPTVHFETLKGLDSRSLPDEDRNPFVYVGEAAPPPVQVATPAPQAAPAPPPPPPLKATGYNELPGGKGEAMITYNDDLQVVHEGDLIGNKFRVVKITPTTITIEDGETHKTLELQFPQ
jgi:hypothetical protein